MENVGMSPLRVEWLSEEPLGIDGPNLYWYARNNPTNYVDPTGEFACGGICIIAIGTAAIAVLSYQEKISEFANDPQNNLAIRSVGYGALTIAGVAARGIVGLFNLFEDSLGNQFQGQIFLKNREIRPPLIVDTMICSLL